MPGYGRVGLVGWAAVVVVVESGSRSDVKLTIRVSSNPILVYLKTARELPSALNRVSDTAKILPRVLISFVAVLWLRGEGPIGGCEAPSRALEVEYHSSVGLERGVDKACRGVSLRGVVAASASEEEDLGIYQVLDGDRVTQYPFFKARSRGTSRDARANGLASVFLAHSVSYQAATNCQGQRTFFTSFLPSNLGTRRVEHTYIVFTDFTVLVN